MEDKTVYECIVEYVEKHAPAGTTEEEKAKMIKSRCNSLLRL